MPTVSELVEYLGHTCQVELLDPDAATRAITHPAGSADADAGSVTFVRAPRRPGAGPVTTRATVLIAEQTIELDRDALRASGVALLALAANPRLEFARLVGAFFVLPPAAGVDPEATVHPEAHIGLDSTVGARASIGHAHIGEECIIEPGARILDGVTLGDRCHVYANAVIGADGFGYEPDANGVPVKFPQLGRVIIGNDVVIGACACVDRGALADTVIADDVKIDNLVHIAHNVRIGRGTMIAASAVVAGSSVVGERVWIGPSATVSNGLTVGDDAEVSLGAVVTRDVPAGTRVSGNFAVEHERFLRFLRTIR